MQAALPEVVQAIADDYIRLMESELPGLMTGFYLHGSVALGAFQPRFSDVDFVTVVSRRCTESDLSRLAAVHHALEKQYPRPTLDGCYLQAEDLGRDEDDIPPRPCYREGTLNPNGTDGANDVTWWQLKNGGIALLGGAPDALEYTVDMDRLTRRMKDNLNTYWKQFTNNPMRMAWLMDASGVEWAVLGVLRQYYTFREREIASKTGAGEYALRHLPKRWHRLIQEALNIRNEVGGSLYRLRLTRAREAVQFLKFVIDHCNTNFV